MTAEGAEDCAVAVIIFFLYFYSTSVLDIIKYIYSLVSYFSDFIYIAQNHNHIASVVFTNCTVNKILCLHSCRGIQDVLEWADDGKTSWRATKKAITEHIFIS